MTPFLKKLLLIVVVAGVIGGLFYAYTAARKEAGKEAEQEEPVKAPTRVEEVGGENVVSLDQATQKASGISVAPLKKTSHRLQIPAYGTVVDLQELSNTRNSIATAQAQLDKASASLKVARQDFERAKSLYQKNENVSEKAMQTADGMLRAEEANSRVAQSAANASQADSLQRWGNVITDWLTRDTAEFERLRVQKDLLIQLTVFPGAGENAGPSVAKVQAANGRFIVGKLVSQAPRTDPRIQGLSFFYVVPVENAPLLPGMNIAALLPMGEPMQGVVVPASAVVWSQGKTWVYQETNSGHFVRREISTEQPVQDGWFETQGVSAGESIVTAGAQFLLSEEFRAEIEVGD